jgi:hypothetical protein
MKKVIISTIITAGFLLAGNAQASNIDPVTESKLVNVCEAIKSDSTLKLHIAIKESGIASKKISSGLVCNGHDPVTFAMVNDAKKTAKYLAKKSNIELVVAL